MIRDDLVAAVQAVIQDGSKSFRAASQLYDQQTRERAWMLYAWCRHCDDMADGQTLGFGPGPKGSVDELREKTHRAVRGERVGELPFDALAQLMRERPIPVRLINDHLDGFQLDEKGWTPESEEDLLRYCYHVAGAVGSMMAVVMGVPGDDRETLDRAADLGIAFQLSNVARDLKEDQESGRCYLPRQWLDEVGLTRETLFEKSSRDGLLVLSRRLVERVGFYERRARLGVPQLPFRSRLAVLTAARIYGAIGRRVGELGEGAWEQRVTIGRRRKLGYFLTSFMEAVTTRPPAH